MSKYSIRLPISALIFYIFLLSLMFFGVIPPLPQIYEMLVGLYEKYGLYGLFIGSLLEGLVYFGLYFPGSLVVAFAVFLSDGSFTSLAIISLTVAIALTISMTINYYSGKNKTLNKFLKPKEVKKEEKKAVKKGFFLSFIHPNTLGYYFYTLGARKDSIKKLVYVPIIMFFYGLALAYLLYAFKDSAKTAVENPYNMIILLSVWFLIAFGINMYKNK